MTRSLSHGEGAKCEQRIAVDNPGRRDGEPGEPTYVDVSFGGQAEACAAHLAKGRQIAISGRLVFREWMGRDRSKRSAHSARGRVEFLEPKVAGDSRTDREPKELAT